MRITATPPSPGGVEMAAMVLSRSGTSDDMKENLPYKAAFGQRKRAKKPLNVSRETFRANEEDFSKKPLELLLETLKRLHGDAGVRITGTGSHDHGNVYGLGHLLRSYAVGMRVLHGSPYTIRTFSRMSAGKTYYAPFHFFTEGSVGKNFLVKFHEVRGDIAAAFPETGNLLRYVLFEEMPLGKRDSALQSVPGFKGQA